jgi:hypothetical protein
MMGWLLGNKRPDHSKEIEEIKATVEGNIEKVAGKRLALEKVIDQMKKDRADASLAK